jgi:hypothetical protein
MDENEWVTVYTVSGRLSAEMIRLLLESFGINAILSQESVGTVYGLTIGDLGEVDIRVPAVNAESAIDILRAMDAGELEIDDQSSPSNKTDLDDNLTKN